MLVSCAGITDTDFQSKYKELVLSVTADLTGTPGDRWNVATNQQLEALSRANRRLAGKYAVRAQARSALSCRQLLQDEQGLAASLALYTNNPPLVWYRLTQPVQPAAADSDGPASRAAGCTSEYCARLITAGVPVDPTSITVSPDYSSLLAGSGGSNAGPGNVTQDPARLAGITVGSVTGAVLLLVLILQRKRIAACHRSSCTTAGGSPATAAESSPLKDLQQQGQSSQGHTRTPYYDRYQKPGDDITYDFRVPQSSTSEAASSGMQYQSTSQQIHSQTLPPPTATPATAAATEVPPTPDKPIIYGQYHSGSLAPWSSAGQKADEAVATSDKPITGVTQDSATVSPGSQLSTDADGSSFSFGGSHTGTQSLTPWQEEQTQQSQLAETSQPTEVVESPSDSMRQLEAPANAAEPRGLPTVAEAPVDSTSSASGTAVTRMSSEQFLLAAQQRLRPAPLQAQSPRRPRVLDPLEQQALANYFARTRQSMQSRQLVPYNRDDDDLQ